MRVHGKKKREKVRKKQSDGFQLVKSRRNGKEEEDSGKKKEKGERYVKQCDVRQATKVQTVEVETRGVWRRRSHSGHLNRKEEI